MNNLELKEAKVKIERLQYIVGTLAQTEEFIETHSYTQKEWKHNLTQSQNVIQWIKNPDMINIKENLADLSNFLKQINNPDTTILDIGCYVGYIYDYIKELIYKDKQFHYTGIDIRKDAISSAKELHQNYENCNFLVGDIFNLDKKLYDVVICSRVLIHLPKIEETICNLLRVSKLALFLIIKTGETSCSLNRKINLTTNKSMTYFYRSISIKDLQDIANKNSVSLSILRNSKKYSSIVFRKNDKS